MLYGLDCLFAPSDNQARRMAALGWSVLGCYINTGPFHTWAHWTNDQVGICAKYFQFMVPIYVGQQAHGTLSADQGSIDGDDANVCAGAAGFNEEQPVCLDMEYGTYQSNPAGALDYLSAWVAKVNGAGHRAILYSDSYTIAHVGTPDLVDLTWGASYVVRNNAYVKPPIGEFDPSSPPPWTGWQFGSGTVANVSVDYSSWVDDVQLAIYTPPS